MNKREFWVKMDKIGISKAEFAAGMGVNISSLYNWNKVPQYAIYIMRFLEAAGDRVLISREDWEGLVATQQRWLGLMELMSNDG